MNSLEDIAKRVEKLEARNAISELVSSYAIACDEHDILRLESLFSEDAEFRSFSGTVEAVGRAAIKEFFISTFQSRGPAFHWTHDNFVRFDPDDPDRATGLVLSHAETTVRGTVSLAAMKYDDVYGRQNGLWRFAKRTIHYLYYVPATEYANGLNQDKRVVVNGIAKEADYPENLPTWQEFQTKYPAD
ncbi:nuclear transport factor 2 family protein [Pacificimonas sp. ICDLI1SI03]